MLLIKNVHFSRKLLNVIIRNISKELQDRGTSEKNSNRNVKIKNEE